MSSVRVESAADGVRIGIHELGGGGPPALLVHATGFHGLVLGPLARGLGARFSSLAPDLRGHGCSGAPDRGEYGWDGFALDVLAAAWVAMPPARAGDTSTLPLVGVGHSLGGTALLLAEAARPGTFAALYCYEPILFRPEQRRSTEVPNAISERARRRRPRFESRAAALERYGSKPPLDGLDPDVLAAYVEHGLLDTTDGAVELALRPEDEALVFAFGFAIDALERLGAVRCPVVLARGGASTDVGRAALEHAASRLANPSIVELPDLGHLGPLEHPATVASSVLATFDAVGHVAPGEPARISETDGTAGA